MNALELRPRLITRLTPFARSRSLAEDIVDEAIFRIVRLEHKRTKYNVWPWLLSISWNLLKDHRKHQGVECRRAAAIASGEQFHSPSQGAIDSELVEALDRALLRLTAVERNAFIAVYLDEMTVADAAAALGKTPGAVKAAAWHGQQKLQSWLRAFAG
jgi:RNA polymerase sigma factor (sigma-70 family)